MITYKIKPHTIRAGEVVEIYMDRMLIGTLTVDDRVPIIRVITKHFIATSQDVSHCTAPGEPSVTVTAVDIQIQKPV
jgi:hypothetical protein